MKIREKLLKIAGKEKYQLDQRIGWGYIMRRCWKYGWMMIRGRLFSIGNKEISGGIFVGRKVRVLEKKNLSVGEKTRLHEGVYIDALSLEGVRIGSGVVIGRSSRMECTGSLRNIGKGIRIGNRSAFGNDCFFGAAGGIEIGEDVIVGQLVRFHAENHNYADKGRLIKEQGVTHRGIRIGNNCWIGSGVVFLDGVQLGDGCIVAANAVVAKSFPPDSVIGGVPAKEIKSRTKSKE